MPRQPRRDPDEFRPKAEVRPGEADAPAVRADSVAAELLRLVLGGALETTASLERLLGVKGSASSERLTYAALGLTLEAYARVSRTVSGTARFASGLATFGASLLLPLLRNPLVGIARLPLKAAAERTIPILDRWAAIGRAEAERSRAATQRLVSAPVDRMLEHLRDDPEMRRLVRSQAEALLAELVDDARVEALVRSQGDRYVDHLRENPEAIQPLVAGQSVGLANEVMNSVRQRAVTLDALVESIARSVLGRRPRSELPAPPARVMYRAEHPTDAESG